MDPLVIQETLPARSSNELIQDILRDPDGFRRTLSPTQKKKFDAALNEVLQEHSEQLLAASGVISSCLRSTPLPTPSQEKVVNSLKGTGVGSISSDDPEDKEPNTLHNRWKTNDERNWAECEEPEVTEEDSIQDEATEDE